MWKTIDGSVSLVTREKLLDGKDHASLVVGVHDGHQERVGPQGADELAQVEVAAFIDVKIRHVIAAALEVLADFQHGRMLDSGGDDVPAVRVGLGRAENGRVVAFRRAGSE